MTNSQLCRQSLSKHFVEIPLKMACFDKVFRQRLCDTAFETDYRHTVPGGFTTHYGYVSESHDMKQVKDFATIQNRCNRLYPIPLPGDYAPNQKAFILAICMLVALAEDERQDKAVRPAEK